MKATKKVAVKKNSLVAGLYMKGSTMANLYERLADGKARTIKELAGCAAERGVNLQNRLYWIGRHAREKSRGTMEVKDGKYRLVLRRKPQAAKRVVIQEAAAA